MGASAVRLTDDPHAMADLHGTFIAAAYGLTAVAIVAELVALWSRRRKAIDRIRRERDFDEDGRGG